MIGSITIRERGPTPRGMKKAYNAAAKAAWEETAIAHHRDNTEKRFTVEHARRAGYTKRKGEGMSRGAKGFASTYYGRKLRSNKGGGVGQADPLVYSGTTKQRARTARVVASRSGAKLRYNTPALNFRHPKSRVNMRDEFTRILPHEVAAIVKNYDAGLDRRLNDNATTTTERVT